MALTTAHGGHAALVARKDSGLMEGSVINDWERLTTDIGGNNVRIFAEST